MRISNFSLLEQLLFVLSFCFFCFFFAFRSVLNLSSNNGNKNTSINSSIDRNAPLTNAQRTAIDTRNVQRQTDIQDIGKQVLQFYVNNNNTWPNGIPTFQTTTDVTGFNQAGNPDCLYLSITDTTHLGCEWVDDYTLKQQLIPNYFTSIPKDPLNTAHYFIALKPDKSSIIVMTNSIEKGGFTSNPENINIFFRAF